MSNLKYIGKNVLNHDLILKKGNVSGSATSTGSFGELSVKGNVAIEGVTADTILDIDSNSVSHIVHVAGNGATQFSGSVDVTGSLNVSQNVTVAGTLTSQEFHTEVTSGSIIFTSGSTKFGDSVDDTHEITGSTTISGSLDVKSGTLKSAGVIVATSTAVSSSFAQKSAVSSSFAQKSGVSGSFILQSALSGSSTVISGSAASTGSFGQLEVAGDVAIEGATANTLLDIDSDSVSHIVHVAGNGATQLSGSLKVTGSIGTSGNVTPSADNSIDLGAASYRWANVYTADLHLNNEGNPNTVDGTTGNWTVQEGEDYIYIVNNKSNKKFKLMLEEIE